MNCIELSIKELEEKCADWAIDIKRDYAADLIIYVARAGYLVARSMIPIIDAPIAGIGAVRKGNVIKKFIAPIISKCPINVRNFLISVELKSGSHAKHSERKIEFHNSLRQIIPEKIKKILVVDDSVDTGNSMLQVTESIRKTFEKADIRIAALNVWDKSENVIHTDYALFHNTIIKAPMSKDSSEYKIFMSIYMKETDNENL